METLIYQGKSLKFFYPMGSKKLKALDCPNLNLPKGKLIALAGPSGSGKSTLLNLLGLIEPIQEGSMLFAGYDIGKLSEKEKTQIRRDDLGFVFQDFLLFDALTAWENVAYFLKNIPISATERNQRVNSSLEAVGLKEHTSKLPLELSGGQKQRVAIARAIAKRPKVIIADEPTASLDQNTGRMIMNIFCSLTKKSGTTVIFASHDPMALEFAELRIKLIDGHAELVKKQKEVT
ncbi:MAG: ABC transporter ATP-binding protein [Oligoflexales bacterium]